jgi:hypothetical protein
LCLSAYGYELVLTGGGLSKTKRALFYPPPVRGRPGGFRGQGNGAGEFPSLRGVLRPLEVDALPSYPTAVKNSCEDGQTNGRREVGLSVLCHRRFTVSSPPPTSSLPGVLCGEIVVAPSLRTKRSRRATESTTDARSAFSRSVRRRRRPARGLGPPRSRRVRTRLRPNRPVSPRVRPPTPPALAAVRRPSSPARREHPPAPPRCSPTPLLPCRKDKTDRRIIGP